MNTEIHKWTGERILWQKPIQHLPEFAKVINWYLEAFRHCYNKRVIDAACGTGFGTFLLSLVASETFGVDKYDMSEVWEKLSPLAPTKFLVLDFDKEAVDISADVCVSIETIEHLENPDFFLSNIRAGKLFFTIPCYGDKHNTFHKIEYDEAKAKALITKYFPELDYRMEGRRMIGLASRQV